MFIKIIMLVLFFGLMIGIGLYCRRNATDVNGFVLGGRAVGPWLTAFAYGTSYFSAVIFEHVPRNATGKIEKPALREKYCGGRLVEEQTKACFADTKISLTVKL